MQWRRADYLNLVFLGFETTIDAYREEQIYRVRFIASLIRTDPLEPAMKKAAVSKDISPLSEPPL